MNFREYYQSLEAKECRKLRDRIIKECDISPFSFYPKLVGKLQWTKLEKEQIVRITKISITKLL